MNIKKQLNGKFHTELMPINISFIGTTGIPNRYGGFESFLEHCAPVIAQKGITTTVTCDANLYTEYQDKNFRGVRREFIKMPANGGASIIHDLIAFFRVLSRSTHIVVLGVSGGPWFPLFRLICSLTGKKLVVNIDGVEWRRTKFSIYKRGVLRVFDWLAQRFSHHVIYDNKALYEFLIPSSIKKSTCIAYPGDHVKRLGSLSQSKEKALTICRIEPENNIDLLISGFLQSSLGEYQIIGNWNHSKFARDMRLKYENQPRLKLLDPIYDAEKLAQIREDCTHYLHGHSVGGTNPSLVEMLFYDCNILCFDVSFNRHTADNFANYFSTTTQLAELLDTIETPIDLSLRKKFRERYSANKIAQSYINALTL